MGIVVDAAAIGQGRERLLHYLLPDSTRRLYRRLRQSTDVRPLGSLADIGIGYVTGDNDFFHLDRETIAAYKLPPQFLRPAVRSGADLSGVRFTPADWEALSQSGHANQLLHIPNGHVPPGAVQQYLADGARRGVPQRYKCRARQPWYGVPHVHEADALLTYMSGSAPKLVANESVAVAPNTLHVVRLREWFGGRQLSSLALAALWQTSLTALSCELEGHSLGGGMLKLEPTEAERVTIPLPDLGVESLEALAEELDTLIRAGEGDAARQCADAAILRRGLGLGMNEVNELRAGWLALQARRLNR